MIYQTISVAQVNPTVGDFSGNVDKILSCSEQAQRRGSEAVVFPEMVVTGYPPYDLLERPSFIEDNLEALNTVVEQTPDIDLYLGYVQPREEAAGKSLYNACAYVSEGEIQSRHYKGLLPTYDVFSEARYFEPGPPPQLTGPGQSVGVSICEDFWNHNYSGEFNNQPRYSRDPFQEIIEANPELLLNLSASPYSRGKPDLRMKMFQSLAREAGKPLVVCNQVGGNDSLVFDGHSVVIDGEGEILASADPFKEDLLTVDFSNQQFVASYPIQNEEKILYEALKLGLGDYFEKCGFSRALVGLSGGIDSSITVTLAVDVLGKENVLGVLMPSQISSDHSVTDAEKLANNLEIETITYPIESLFDQYLDLFKEEFKDTEWDTTEENLQARIRGNILMALSNKFGYLVLSTGNKSELAVGYCTLYGDMNGGLAVLSDVPKTMVYQLCHYRNQQKHVIPNHVLEKTPSAELAPDQNDQDSLPPYEILDEIIERYVEKKQSRAMIKEAGFEPDIVDEVVHMIDQNEYKRRQAPPGIKVTSKAFSAGRMIPIAQRF